MPFGFNPVAENTLHVQSDFIIEKSAYYYARFFLTWHCLEKKSTADEAVDTVREKNQYGMAISKV